MTPADALARYEHRTRRLNLIYFAVVAVIVAVAATVATVVIDNGEAAHATLRTVDHEPADVRLDVPSTTQTQAWRTDDRTAIGTPLWGGTLVTYDTHTVGGRDARTGVRTWRYTRSDRTVCTAAQVAGTTVAVYRRDRTCDEVSAFDSGTGKRFWTRTLDEDGQPLDDARPTYAISDKTFAVISPTVIYALATDSSGIDRFTYSRYGCTIEHVVLGSAGALISQDCGSHTKCGELSFCGKGQQLLLRGLDGRDDRGKNPKNYDRVQWNHVGDTGVPVSADSVVSALRPGSNALDVFDPTNGRTVRTIALDPAPSSLSGIVTADTVSAEVSWIDGHVVVLVPGSGTPTWSVAAPAPPSVVDITGADTPLLSDARITVRTATGLATLDPRDGRVTGQYALSVPTGAAAVYPLGTGFAISSASGTVVFR